MTRLQLARSVFAIAGVALLVAGPAQAQIVPDASLGLEGSLVTPGVLVEDAAADLIEGGAVRGSNLFHSFLEFNIEAGQRVYFANPAGVESILSRVTGANPSNIFGTLGVDGAADLFLINPNGLVFGETAVLDIEGSFYAATAAAIPLGYGVYSATEPAQSSLLTVSPSAVFSSYLTQASGDIENRGQLAVQGDLTLAANTLDLQGQLAAGGDLTLLGSTVQIRDAVDTPFVGFAGGELLVQGNEQVDIVALSHPDSGLYSYGDMVLRSANPVGGDAHYFSGGSFRVENLDGEAGSLFSPIDPIIRSFGDVVIDQYEGSSLHILAGGSVFLGTATIRSGETGALGVDFLRESVELSDGTVVEVDGGAQPTLDVRAGVLPEAIGAPPLTILTGFDPATDRFLGNAFETGVPSSADITVGDVFMAAPNGLVLLTTQYQPNADLAGGSISVTGAGIYGDGIDARGFGGQGGAVYLDARSDVSVTNSFISTTGLGEVGDIVIGAGGTVRFDGTNGSRLTGAFANIAGGGEGTGGNIRINAASLDVLNGAQINALVFGNGQGGNVTFNIEGLARFDGSNPIDGSASRASSSIAPNGVGRGGDVQITAGSLEVLNGVQLSASTFGQGEAGSVVLVVEGLARFDGSDPIDGSASGAFSRIERNSVGRGGDVQITAGSLEVLNGAQLSAGTFGQGEAGSVVLVVEGLARFDGSDPIDGSGSGAFSSIAPNGVGRGGDVQITAGSLAVLNGAQLNASTFGQGEAGSVVLVVEGLARFDGSNPIDGSPSGAFSSIERNGVGRGGDVQITAGSLAVLNGAQLSAATLGQGEAGSVILVVEGLARFDGTDPIDGSVSGAFSSIQPTGVGRGGDVQITAGSLAVLNGAQLGASTFGQGEAGSVVLVVEGLAHFDGSNPIDGSASGAFSDITPTGEGRGGDVQITAGSLEVLNGAVLGAGTFGQGDAGSVVLVVEGLARFDGSDPIDGSASGAFSSIQPNGEGRGGDVQITAGFLEVLNGAQLSAGTFGQGEAGSVVLVVEGLARFDGTNPNGSRASGAFSSIQPTGEGRGGDVQITAGSLEVLNGAGLSAATFGQGDAGSVVLVVEGLARFDGTNPIDGNSSGASSSIDPTGVGRGGDVQITAGSLEVLNGAQLSAATSGQGDAGSVVLVVEGLARFEGTTPNGSSASGAFSSIDSTGVGRGGNIEIRAQILEILEGAFLFAASLGSGDAGNIILVIPERLSVDDGTIAANAETFSGGQINVQAGGIILRNDGDIQTFVGRGAGGGGNITIAADFLVALDDSDILAFSADGTGGNIDLGRTPFLGQNANIASGQLSREALLALDGNDLVDVNATGGVASGQIIVGDSSFIENSLTSLADTIVDASSLTAGSCIARIDESLGSFTVTGSGGLPQRPGDTTLSTYPTGTVRAVAEPTSTPAIQEPDGVYQLADGRLVLSRQCE